MPIKLTLNRKTLRLENDKFILCIKSIHFSTSSFKIVIIFDYTLAEINTKSADALLKMIAILKELRIAQLCSKNERTLVDDFFSLQNQYFLDLVV